MNLHVIGVVKEIIYSNENNEAILLQSDYSQLVCTITSRNKDLMFVVEEGDKVALKGKLTVSKKRKRIKTYRNNTFFVNDIEIIKKANHKKSK